MNFVFQARYLKNSC